MPRTLVAMHLGVRHALSQIVEVPVAEHRITRTPQQQDGHREVANTFGDSLQCRRARVIRAHGNVLDEIPHRCSARGTAIRRPKGASDAVRHARAAQRCRDAQEDREDDGVKRPHRTETSRGDHMRNPAVTWLVHRRVGQYDSAHLRAVLYNPPERDGTTPVVGENDDRSIDAQRGGHPAKVIDALRQTPPRRQPLTEAHAQVIDRHHPHVARRGRHDSTPQIRPGGVSMNGQNSESRLGDSIVQHMPRT